MVTMSSKRRERSTLQAHRFRQRFDAGFLGLPLAEGLALEAQAVRIVASGESLVFPALTRRLVERHATERLWKQDASLFGDDPTEIERRALFRAPMVKKRAGAIVLGCRTLAPK